VKVDEPRQMDIGALAEHVALRRTTPGRRCLHMTITFPTVASLQTKAGLVPVRQISVHQSRTSSGPYFSVQATFSASQTSCGQRDTIY
jgi:hypothetical protein